MCLPFPCAQASSVIQLSHSAGILSECVYITTDDHCSCGALSLFPRVQEIAGSQSAGGTGDLFEHTQASPDSHTSGGVLDSFPCIQSVTESQDRYGAGTLSGHIQTTTDMPHGRRCGRFHPDAFIVRPIAKLHATHLGTFRVCPNEQRRPVGFRHTRSLFPESTQVPIASARTARGTFWSTSTIHAVANHCAVCSSLSTTSIAPAVVQSPMWLRRGRLFRDALKYVAVATQDPARPHTFSRVLSHLDSHRYNGTGDLSVNTPKATAQSIDTPVCSQLSPLAQKHHECQYTIGRRGPFSSISSNRAKSHRPFGVLEPFPVLDMI